MAALTPNDVPGLDDWNQLLAGRTAVVTGGGAGIGRATVELFVAHGAEVHVAELDPDLVVEVGAIDGVIAHHVDVRDPDRVTYRLSYSLKLDGSLLSAPRLGLNLVLMYIRS